MTVVQSGEQEIQILCPENHLDKIYPQQSAKINFWALENVSADGYIREIAPMADSVTRTYKVRVAVPQMPAAVKLGMTAKVHLQNGTDSSILLPATAIYQTGGNPQVWLVTNNKVHTHEVSIGGYEGNNVRISDGLQQGDIVVVGGVNKLAEDQKRPSGSWCQPMKNNWAAWSIKHKQIIYFFYVSLSGHGHLFL